MQSIAQLIKLFKSFQANAFIFFTNIEPLILADSIPGSIQDQINSDEFLQLLNDCSNAIRRLDNFINVLNPSIAKEIKKLFHKNKSSKDRILISKLMIRLFSRKLLNRKAFNPSSNKPKKTTSQFVLSIIEKSLNSMGPVRIAVHLQVTSMTIISEVNIDAKLVGIPSPSRLHRLIPSVSTVRIVDESLLDIMTAENISSISVRTRNVLTTRRTKNFTTKAGRMNSLLPANSIVITIITVNSSSIWKPSKTSLITKISALTSIRYTLIRRYSVLSSPITSITVFPPERRLWSFPRSMVSRSLIRQS